jgi:predicted Fe-Mo cluster-binding NifX family protein
MKVVIPVSFGRVSTVFDFARNLLLIEYEDGRELSRSELAVEEDLPLSRARRLQRLGARVLICGAISRPLAEHLTASGVDIIPFVSGPVEEVLAGYAAGEIESARFLMPGSTTEDRRVWRMRCPARDAVRPSQEDRS